MSNKNNDNRTFGDGPCYWLNACVGRNGGPYGFDDYAEGYYEAAKRLVEGCDERSRHIDVLIYPIAFNYRHAIELSIKHLGRVLPRIWREQVPTHWTHKLNDNWLTVRGYLKREKDFDPDGSLIPEMSELIDDLLAIDHNGEVFRYPNAKGGTGYLLDRSIINVDRLGRSVVRAYEIFEWWDFQADRLWNACCEYCEASA